MPVEIHIRSISDIQVGFFIYTKPFRDTHMLKSKCISKKFTVLRVIYLQFIFHLFSSLENQEIQVNN